jgi:TetR/AcrR family transcriptional regulator, mexJK operon transcriptional repressor
MANRQMSVERQRRRKQRGPGRPRDLVKLAAILDAAYALFLERGIATTTMDAVAERASVSKMTIYANFRDKPALLAAVFDRRIKSIRELDIAVGADLGSSIERLVKLGEAFVSSCTRPEIIRMNLLMAECADENPRLAATFYAAGRGEVLKRVVAFLEALTARGFLSIKDPELAAEQLFGAWSGMIILRQALGLAKPPSADAIAKRVRHAVDTLVRAWSPSPRRSTR